jgi:hypothetical protein
MKPQPEPSWEVLAGLERVTFHNGENGFSALRIKARGQGCFWEHVSNDFCLK